jgi:adenylyl-sulfate kinase
MGRHPMHNEKKLQTAEKIVLNYQAPKVIWLTGLSGAGKSTISYHLQEELLGQGIDAYVLDGDHLRLGLNADLGFSKKDRTENLRRAAEVAKLFNDAGFVVICAFISPFSSVRQKIRKLFRAGEFVEIFVDCSIKECEKRDPKGLYAKFRKGDVKDFTGISSPYEKPIKPEVYLNTEELSIQDSVRKIMNFLAHRDKVGVTETLQRNAFSGVNIKYQV